MCVVPTIGRRLSCIYCTLLCASVQLSPSQMSQNHQRGSRKGNTNPLFIKHRSDQFHPTNMKNNRNSTERQKAGCWLPRFRIRTYLHCVKKKRKKKNLVSLVHSAPSARL